jgi:hypothetical protein
MKLLTLLFVILFSSIAFSQTPQQLSTRPSLSGLETGTDLQWVVHGGNHYKWSLTNSLAWYTAQLPFLPTNSVITGCTWQANPVSTTYGGTGANLGSSSGFLFDTAGTVSAINTITLATPLTAPHFCGNSTAPTKAAGTGAGTSPTITLDSSASDASGYLTVLTGTTPAGTAATIVTLTFSSTYATAPHIALTPHSATAAALGTTTQVWVDSTTGTLVLKSGSAGLTASTTYIWSYVVVQ